MSKHMEPTTHLVVPAILDSTIRDADVGKMFNLPHKHVVFASGPRIQICRVEGKRLIPQEDVWFSEEVSSVRFVPLLDTKLDIICVQFCSGNFSIVYPKNNKLVVHELVKAGKGVVVDEKTLFLDTCRSMSMIAMTGVNSLYRFQFSTYWVARRHGVLPFETPIYDIKMTSGGDVALLSEDKDEKCIYVCHYLEGTLTDWKCHKLESQAYGFVSTPLEYTSMVLYGDGKIVIVSSDYSQSVVVVNVPSYRISSGVMWSCEQSLLRLLLTGPHGVQNLLRIDPSGGSEPVSSVVGHSTQTWKFLVIEKSTLLNVSRSGDSNLYDFDAEKSSLTCRQNFRNLGPIKEMALWKDGEERTVVVVSGEGVDCSLRLLSSFYRIKNKRTIPIENVKRAFSMQLRSSRGNINLLLSSTENHTTALAVIEKEEYKVTPYGEGTFDTDPTIAAQHLLDHEETIIQVCPNTINVIKRTAEFQWTRTPYPWAGPIQQAHISMSGKVLITFAQSRMEVIMLTRKPEGVVPETFRCHKFASTITSITSVHQEARLESHTAPTHVLVVLANCSEIAVMTLPNLQHLFTFKTDIANPTGICVVGKTIVITGSDGMLAYSSTLDLNSKSTGFIRYDTSRIYGLATRMKNEIFVGGDRPVFISSLNQGLAFCEVKMPIETASMFYNDGSTTTMATRLVASSNNAFHFVDIGRSEYTIHLREICTSVAFSRDIDVLAVGLHRVATGPMADFKTASCLEEDLISHSGIKNGRQLEFDSQPATYTSSVLFVLGQSLHRVHVHKYGAHEVVMRVLAMRVEGSDSQLFIAVSHLDYCARARIVIFILVAEDELTTFRIAADYEFEGTPSNVEIDGQWIFISSGEDLMTYQLICSDGEFKIHPRQSVKEEETIEEMQTDGQHVLVAGKSSSTEYLRTDTNQLERVNKWLLPACKMILYNGIYMRASTNNKVIQKYMIPLKAGDDPSTMPHEGNYYLGRTPTQLLMTSSDVKHQCLMEHQFIYGTSAGHLGWGLSLKPEWAVLLKRAVDCLLTSDYFKSRIEKHLPIVEKRKEYEAKSFIDGEVFVRLLNLKDEDCMLALENMTFEDSTPGMPTNNGEFIKFLSELYQMTVLSCDQNYRR